MRITRLRGGLLPVAAIALGLAGGALAAPGPVVQDLNQGVTPPELAQSLVGAGVAISNVAYTGDNRAAGKFTAGAASVGFDDGIVLGSGKVQSYPTDARCSRGVEGPNDCHEIPGQFSEPSLANSTDFGRPGDPSLDALAGFATQDAAVLQFDFVPQYPTIQFRYVFSSEEYSDFSNSDFNDVFAFLVNGKNCATVPGSGQPVSVNTINNGNDATEGDPTPHNPALFRDNVRPAPTLDTQMDGLTVVLACNAKVNAGVVNHLKLAIADASDGILDSAVFIQAGSLISGTQIATSLSGGGRTGSALDVPTGTQVTDQATLAGANASAATGTISYKVYSDPGCTTLFADAGTKGVAAGVVPPADPVTLVLAGTYYWLASYSGDAGNNASSSPCGAETALVKLGPPALVGLDPATAGNVAGDTHTVTATVTDARNTPTPAVTVRFSVSGPNGPQTGVAVTDASGKATFTFTGTHVGTDTISAYADTNANGTQDAGEPAGSASKTWVAAAPATVSLTPKSDVNPVDAQHCVTAAVVDRYGNPNGGTSVLFTVTGATAATATRTTDASGSAQFCYTGPALPGADVITAFADTNGNGTLDATEPKDTADKTWVLPAGTPGCIVAGAGRITAANGDKAIFGALAKASTPAGELGYQDPGPAAKVTVVSVQILAVVCSADRKSASIFATALVAGSGRQAVRVDVKDLGGPGRHDTYRIRLATGYDSGEQTLTLGDIQIR